MGPLPPPLPLPMAPPYSVEGLGPPKLVEVGGPYPPPPVQNWSPVDKIVCRVSYTGIGEIKWACTPYVSVPETDNNILLGTHCLCTTHTPKNGVSVCVCVCVGGRG